MMTDVLQNNFDKVLINNVVFFKNCKFDTKASIFCKPFYLKEKTPFKIGFQDLNFHIFVGNKQFKFSFSLNEQLTFLRVPLKSISRVKQFFIFKEECEYLIRVYVHPINQEIFQIRCQRLSPIKIK